MHHVRPVVVCTTRLCFHGTRSSWVGRKAPQPTAVGGGLDLQRRVSMPTYEALATCVLCSAGGPCLNRDVTLT